MSYIALCYVNVGKRLYTHGEIINELPDKVAERLIRLRAVCAESADRPVPVKRETTRTETQAAEEVAEEEAAEEKTTAEEETAEDNEPEPAPPEIDAMEGVVEPVQAKADEPEAKATATRKPAAKKAAGKKPAGRGTKK
ncbi:MAG: hypothetical protein LLF96_01305 [Eubacteriales bacterium]|nr:hypothetical protein [Eubacteriales bacterium]